MIDGYATYDYEERLRLLDLSTLLYRRGRSLQTLLYVRSRFIVQYVSTAILRIESTTTSWCGKKAKDDVRVIQPNSFYFRITKIWNDLPAKTVNSVNTLNEFKTKLDLTGRMCRSSSAQNPRAVLRGINAYSLYLKIIIIICS